MTQASIHSENFVQALNDKLASGYPDVDYKGFGVQPGRRYDRIVTISTSTRNGESITRPDSVHAFIERQSGDLIKAAGWAAPQKNSDGSLAVRFHLGDEDGFREAIARADRFASYLYQQ